MTSKAQRGLVALSGKKKKKSTTTLASSFVAGVQIGNENKMFVKSRNEAENKIEETIKVEAEGRERTREKGTLHE